MDQEHTIEFAGLRVVSFPLDPEAPLPPEAGSDERFAWRLEVDPYTGAEFKYTLPELFALFQNRVDTSRVEAIVFGLWSRDMGPTGHPVDVLVAAADRLPGLRKVFIGDVGSEDMEISWMANPPVTPVLEAFPQLEELWVRGAPQENIMMFSPVRHARLRTLVFQSGSLSAEVIRAMVACELPELEHLEIYFGDEDYGGGEATVDDVREVLTGERYPKLRYLGLKDAEFEDKIAAAVAHAPVVARLEVLDLSLGTLGDEGAAALLAGQPLTHLCKLDLRHNYLSDEMAGRLGQALPGVEIDVSERRWHPQDRRYVAVGE